MRDLTNQAPFTHREPHQYTNSTCAKAWGIQRYRNHHDLSRENKICIRRGTMCLNGIRVDRLRGRGGIERNALHIDLSPLTR